jgi:4-hydroxy 2-oxovalerate aldolase
MNGIAMSQISPLPDLMEVTLRDGSYVIDFQFTAEDTANLVSALEGAGFRWIEIGHGLGLNAQDTGKRRAVASDEEHLAAAQEAAKKAKWGSFFIPGIGRKEDIDLAARYGMSFIRIGTNVTESERARPFIEYAKEKGLFVCYNAMKSYAIAPRDYAKIAKQVSDWGADMVYVVDSAGTMLPEDVAAFMKAIQAETDTPIGFHGHDNLSMGMANTLQALESGAAIVDASLRGMGRSAGNVITEALLAIMQRRGQWQDIDLKATMDISAGMIAPLVPGRGLDTMAITAGMAGFHSSFTAKVQGYAEQYEIDVRDLIVRLCEINRIDAPDDLLEQLSKDIAREKQAQEISIPAFQARAETGQTDRLESLFKRLYSESQKNRSYTSLNMVLSQTLEEDYTVSQHIHNTPTHSIGSVTFSTEMQMLDVLNAADGKVDTILLDIDRRRIFGPQMAAITASEILKKSRLLIYSDSRLWAEAVKDQVVRLLDEQVQGAKIVIAGDHRRSRLLALMLIDYGADVTMVVRHQEEEDEYSHATHVFTQTDYPLDDYVDAEHAEAVLDMARLVVVWPSWGTWFDERYAAHLRKGTFLIDAGIKSIVPAGIAKAQDVGALPIRINIWPTLAGTLLAAHVGSQSQAQQGTIAAVPVVSGGAIGERGAVVVDDVQHPSRIIGVADGEGGLLAHTADFAEHIRRVTELINLQRIQPQMSEG